MITLESWWLRLCHPLHQFLINIDDFYSMGNMNDANNAFLLGMGNQGFQLYVLISPPEPFDYFNAWVPMIRRALKSEWKEEAEK